jgi:alpha-D-ribose 1-methylphosphonate 5-triphosphate synthase subunit PhnG
MAVLARADADAIRTLLPQAALPACTVLRPPEPGLVMVQGRAGGTGAPFNLGEMTVTRCTVRSPGGALGHATIPGRDRDHAKLAATLDAGLQDPVLHDALHAAVVAPLAEAQRAAREAREGKARATEVQFFTLATTRG